MSQSVKEYWVARVRCAWARWHEQLRRRGLAAIETLTWWRFWCRHVISRACASPRQRRLRRLVLEACARGRRRNLARLATHGADFAAAIRSDGAFSVALASPGGISCAEYLFEQSLPPGQGFCGHPPLVAAAEIGATGLLAAWNRAGERWPRGCVTAAARYGHANALRCILAAGGDPNELDIEGTPALRLAIKACREGHALAEITDCVTALLDHGADPDTLAADGGTALHRAARCDYQDLVHLLLARGADPTLVDRVGCSALVAASYAGSVGAAAVLSQTGAQDTLAAAAARGDLPACMIILQEGIHPDTHDGYGRTAVYWASVRGQRAALDLLFAHGAHDDILSAAMAGDLARVQVALAAEAGHPQRWPRTPGGWTPLMASLDNGCDDVARALLAAGADSNEIIQSCPRSPLHAAAEFCEPDTVRALLTAGATVDPRDWRGDTPLAVAVRANRLDIVRLLLDAGADPDGHRSAAACRLGRQTPLVESACRDRRAVFRLLLTAGADTRLQTNETRGLDRLDPTDRTSRRLQSLVLGSRSAARERRQERITPLVRACRAHDTVTVRILLAHGATPDADALVSAAGHGDRALVARLLLHGSDPHRPDRNGRLASETARRQGHLVLGAMLDGYGS